MFPVSIIQIQKSSSDFIAQLSYFFNLFPVFIQIQQSSDFIELHTSRRCSFSSEPTIQFARVSAGVNRSILIRLTTRLTFLQFDATIPSMDLSEAFTRWIVLYGPLCKLWGMRMYYLPLKSKHGTSDRLSEVQCIQLFSIGWILSFDL